MKALLLLLRTENQQQYCLLIYKFSTVDSQYNEPRREMKNSLLYREFVKSKTEKNREFLLKY